MVAKSQVQFGRIAIGVKTEFRTAALGQDQGPRASTLRVEEERRTA